jgi:hypothetical protein
MPSTHELLVLLIAVFAVWFLLKMVRVAVKLILFVIMLLIVGGVLWHVFLR